MLTSKSFFGSLHNKQGRHSSSITCSQTKHPVDFIYKVKMSHTTATVPFMFTRLLNALCFLSFSLSFLHLFYLFVTCLKLRVGLSLFCSVRSVSVPSFFFFSWFIFAEFYGLCVRYTICCTVCFICDIPLQQVVICPFFL